MTIAELDMNVQTIRELTATIEQLTAELEAAKDAVKAEMVERGEEVLTGNGWKATWKTVTSTRLDSKALKAEKPELFEQYSRTSTVCRFCLT